LGIKKAALRRGFGTDMLWMCVSDLALEEARYDGAE
jgi:hypothetical protein